MPLATVHDVIRTTPRTRLVRLDLDASPFAFRAGQAVMVGRRDRQTRSPYSIASAPSAARHGRLELLVSADGAFGDTGVDPLALPGTTLVVDGPIGAFGVPAAAAGAPLLLVAGGTGISPLRSVILDLLDGPHPPPIALVYSARAAEEFAFGGELDALARAGRLALYCTVTRDEIAGWPGRTGRIDDGLLRAAWPGGDAWALVCGPGPFVTGVSAALARLDIAAARVVVER